ncbi:MAG: 2,5-diamino-6-(ribosylamino)-4(3H)-pyrimidinone 5'-phosphate reductase [Methanomassiliicoccales archaeon]|nr:MAG: 2,5-diamino-6-(ribosylamino)-4(3H)-pyrimidinone 5'-phosphate reductase [Methanomassiliicoccales archaeon]
MRPRVIVNCAMSADGKIASKERRQLRISSDEDLARVKALRLDCDAVCVGVGTVIADDPHLTVKGRPREEQPLRIVIDPNGRTPDGAKVLNDWADTLIVTNIRCRRRWPGAEVLRSGEDRVNLRSLMAHLEASWVKKLLVEGGGETIWSFFEAGLVDEYHVYIGPMVIGGRDAPTPVDGAGFTGSSAVKLRLTGHDRMGEGVLLSFEVVKDV